MSSYFVSVGILAEAFNVTGRRVQQLAQDDIIPKSVRGKYDLIACTAAYTKYLHERATGKDIEPQDVHKERTRLLKAQADKTELEVKSMNGELIAAEQVELLWGGLVSAFRAKIMGLPVRCAHRVLNLNTYQEIEEVLRGHVNEALEELSCHEPGESNSLIKEGGEDGGAAAKLENQPVGGSVPAT